MGHFKNGTAYIHPAFYQISHGFGLDIGRKEQAKLTVNYLEHQGVIVAERFAAVDFPAGVQDLDIDGRIQGQGVAATCFLPGYTPGLKFGQEGAVLFQHGSA
nr:hypothetical protein [Moorella humiferrea]